LQKIRDLLKAAFLSPTHLLAKGFKGDVAAKLADSRREIANHGCSKSQNSTPSSLNKVF
jgi:hypothetical protein